MIEAKRAAEPEGVRNNFRTSRLIGKAITDRKDAYLQSIETAQSLEKVRQVKIVDNPELEARLDPGIIIDFPRFEISTDRWTFFTRSCLTICSGDAQSKIWTRLALALPDDPRKLSLQDLDCIRTLSQSLAEASNEALKGQYQEDFSTVVGDDVALDSMGKIEVFAVDCVGQAISREIRESYSAFAHGFDNRRHLDEGEIADTMRTIAKISMPEQGRDSSPDLRFTLHEKADFVPFQSSKGVESLFVAATRDGCAYLGGLVDAGPDTASPKIYRDQNKSFGVPYSLSSTAELAIEIGSVY